MLPLRQLLRRRRNRLSRDRQVAAEELRVVRKGGVLVENHPPRDAPPDGRRLVQREIHAAVIVQEQQNALQSVFAGGRTASVRFDARSLGAVIRRAVSARRLTLTHRPAAR